ncbi:MAG TPA: uracil-DNA glycosylase [Reyranella sp.]|nr:uracil-DNA glycosylase [Reyranella sp.]
MAAAAFEEPSPDCPRCPRLVAFRNELRAKHPDWKNAPVPSFGKIDARLLIVGLAPGMKGANRTGRPFTGDYAGDLLYATLAKYGFSRGTFKADPGDGLQLVDCRIANAVRCLPPENKPTPAEFTQCRPFIQAELAMMPDVKVILALGKGAHDQVLRALTVRPAGSYPFIHARLHDLPTGLTLADSYHCSRYNTNTGRLTTAMFENVFEKIRHALPA